MTHHDRGTEWFLAQLKPNALRIAERNLRRQAFRTFVPLEQKTMRRNGKFEPVVKPLFPGYLFVSFDPEAGRWHAINSTQGITRLVAFGAAPSPVPHSLIAELQSRCDDSGRLLPPRALNPGDTVQLRSGPFADFTATIERVEPDRRVWILLDLMGRATRLRVRSDALQSQ